MRLLDSTPLRLAAAPIKVTGALVFILSVAIAASIFISQRLSKPTQTASTRQVNSRKRGLAVTNKFAESRGKVS